ncbi:OmpA/MotB family protein [Ideonella margarita]|uniref:OmpA-like domain-containing protein n=1 Tax=Ideonella margarita TaxID=2984191 RepID=A0ABU9C8Q2_9BURK
MLLLKQRGGQRASTSAEGEGSYLASASDLMIGLLFVFIILVVVLALEQHKQQQVLIGLTNASDPRAGVTVSIGEALKQAKLDVRVDPSTGIISLPSDVLFNVGSSTLSATAKQSLSLARDRLAVVLPCYVHSTRNKLTDKDCPNNLGRHEVDTIFFEGHTDNRVNPAPGGNLTLSFDRARAIQDEFLGAGSPLIEYKNSFNQPIYSYSAYGDTRLLANVAGHDASNRRVDMRIVLRYQSIQETLNQIGKATGGR